MTKVGFRVSFCFPGHDWYYEWKTTLESADAYAAFLRRMGAEEVFVDPVPTTVQIQEDENG